MIHLAILFIDIFQLVDGFKIFGTINIISISLNFINLFGIKISANLCFNLQKEKNLVALI